MVSDPRSPDEYGFSGRDRNKQGERATSGTFYDDDDDDDAMFGLDERGQVYQKERIRGKDMEAGYGIHDRRL